MCKKPRSGSRSEHPILNYYEYDEDHYLVTDLVPVKREEMISDSYLLERILSSTDLEFVRCPECNALYLRGYTGSSDVFFIHVDTGKIGTIKIYKGLRIHDCSVCEFGILMVEHEQGTSIYTKIR